MNMIDLKSGMCRWPFGNPEDKDFHFCGDRSEPDSSYCKKHMAESKAPTRKKSKAKLPMKKAS